VPAARTVVKGHARLADAELLLHHGADLAGGALAVREQLQDPAPDRIPENVEGVHDLIIIVATYISKL
jgi:hypothetical protein